MTKYIKFKLLPAPEGDEREHKIRRVQSIGSSVADATQMVCHGAYAVATLDKFFRLQFTGIDEDSLELVDSPPPVDLRTDVLYEKAVTGMAHLPGVGSAGDLRSLGFPERLVSRLLAGEEVPVLIDDHQFASWSLDEDPPALLTDPQRVKFPFGRIVDLTR